MSYKLCYDHKTKKPLPPIYLCTTRGCSTRGGTYADIMKSLGDLLVNAAAKLDVTEEEGKPAFDPSEHSREIYKSQLDELQKQQERLYDFLERGIYDEETFLTRNRALREKIGAAEARLAELNENEKTAEEKERFRSSIQACIDALADPSSTAESLNKVLKQLLRRIDYQRERTTRFRRDSVPIDLSLVFM
jgi:chromosome segregation ATPase